MKLFEMKELPQKAGMALLKFQQYADTPHRSDSTIVLPNNPEHEFFPLKQGAQFLFRQNSTDYNDKTTSKYWFGGTEHSPFLVSLTKKPFEAFQEGGEAAFFDSLKPEVIKKCEELFGGGNYLRQGDIFAIPLPYTWQELNKISTLSSGQVCQGSQTTNEKLFGTRHVFAGICTKFSVLGKNHFIGTGTLAAPDHPPLILDHGIFLFAQAQGLVKPAEAD